MSRPKWVTETIKAAKKNGWDTIYKNGFVLITRPEGVFKIMVQEDVDDTVEVELYKFSGGSHVRTGKPSHAVNRSIEQAEYMLRHRKMGVKWMSYSFDRLKIACSNA